MLRTALALTFALGILAAAPMASTARAETPRQVFLENHPRIAADVWAYNHPYRSGLLPYVPPVDRVIVAPVVAPPVVVDPVIRVYHPYVRRWFW